MVLICLTITWFNWQTIKTDNFTVVYKPGYEWEATQAMQNLEYYRQKVVNLTGKDTRKLLVVIEDIGTSSNGFANPLFNNVHIFTYPPGSGSSFEGIEDWYRIVNVHEFTHIAHMTLTNGFPGILTGIFGSIFQPNMYSPGWIIEGITVFSESQISGYEGRLNDGFFDSYIGSRVFADRFPTIVEATNEPLSFPNGKAYLCGGEFFNYLSTRYGSEKFTGFFKNYGSCFWAPLSAFFPCTGLDRAARSVYGKTFPSLFAEWRDFEKKHYAEWQPGGESITDQGWYISSLIEYHDKLYFARTAHCKVNAFADYTLYQIIELDIGAAEEKVIASLTSPVSTPLRIHDNTLYYTTFELKKAANVSENGYGVTSVLHRLNLINMKDQTLLSDEIRGFCILPDKSIIYSKDQRHSFGSELYHFRNGEKTKIWVSEYLINEIVADSNNIVVIARRNGENWNLYLLADVPLYRYETEDTSSYHTISGKLIPLITSPWVECSVNLKDGCLIFTANYDKTYADYAMDLEEYKTYRLTDGGYANFGGIIADSLYYIGLSKNGFDVYKKSTEPIEYEIPQFDSVMNLPVKNEVRFTKGNYFDVLRTLSPAIRIPYIFPADTTFKKWLYGGVFIGGDATDENTYGILFAYDQMDETPVFDALVSSRFFNPVRADFEYFLNERANLLISMPVINRLSPGLSGTTLGLRLRAYSEFKRKELSPIIKLTFREYSSVFSATFAIPMERENFGSEITRTAQVLNLSYQQVQFSGEFSIKVLGFNDPQNPDIPSVSINGYGVITTRRGAALYCDYTHRLYSIRWGLWNPNIYFEDIFASVFFDFAVNKDGWVYFSRGFKLKQEIKTAFGFIPFVPEIGVAVIDGANGMEFKTFFHISTDFSY